MSGKRDKQMGTAARMAPSTPKQENQSPAPPGFQHTSASDLFDMDLLNALRSENIADARDIVANAEVILSAHKASRASAKGDLSPIQIVAAKAQIAIAVGDTAAAKAILVRGLDIQPDAPSLRALLTEVMLSQGRATDVRPILQHLKRFQKKSKKSAGVSASNPNHIVKSELK